MKQTLLFLLIVACLCCCVLAQQLAVDQCPKIEVVGPSSTTRPGEEMKFHVLVGNRLDKNLTFNWTVSAGTLSSGQGTPMITVSTEGLFNISVTATVAVAGGSIASFCNSNAAETGQVISHPPNVDYDTFGKLPDDNVRGRLDNVFILLQNDPQAEAWIFIDLKKTDTRAQKRRRLRLYANHISFRRFDPSRITFVIKDAVENSTQIRMRFAGMVEPVEPDEKIVYGEYLREELPKLFAVKKK